MKENLEVPKENSELKRSLLAFEWANARMANGAPQVLLPPTVQEGLANTPQVLGS